METIVCANHPARRASLTCERCGSYACSDCAIDAPWGASVCAACKARGGLCYPLVWERGSPWNPLRFVRSAREIVLEAPTLFANLPNGGVLRALGFCAWVALCLAFSSLLADVAHMRFDWHDEATRRAIALYVLSQLMRQSAQTYVLVGLSALGFHALARLSGGQGSARLALRAAAYGSAFLLFNALTALTDVFAPFLELAALIVAAMAQAYLYFVGLRAAAVEQYGVSRARAEVVAGATLGMLVPSMLSAMLIVGAIGRAADHALSNLLH